MKLQKTDIERQTAGMGTSSLISPATMIGTEQIMVTKIVKAILSGSVIAASNLDIVKFIQKVRLTKSAFKRRKRLILPENSANDGSYQNRKIFGSYIHMEH
jgi:hypothetical protein